MVTFPCEVNACIFESDAKQNTSKQCIYYIYSKTTGLFNIPYIIFHVYTFNLQTAYLLFSNKWSIIISLLKKLEYDIPYPNVGRDPAQE